jgi:hypothetical protein
VRDVDPLVLARLDVIADAADGPSLVQAYMDLITFGPDAFPTLLAVAHGEVALPPVAGRPPDSHDAVVGAIAWLGRRYPDEMFAALGDPAAVDPRVAFAIEPIDDARTTEILLTVVLREELAAQILPALVRRREPRVVAVLERYLFSTNRGLRARAAEGLYAMHPRQPEVVAAASTALDAEDDPEIAAVLRDALHRIDDPADTRELHWFWTTVARKGVGVAAFDLDDVARVVAALGQPAAAEAATRRAVDLHEPGHEGVGRTPPVGLPCIRGRWAPTEATVWRIAAR